MASSGKPSHPEHSVPFHMFTAFTRRETFAASDCNIMLGIDHNLIANLRIQADAYHHVSSRQRTSDRLND